MAEIVQGIDFGASIEDSFETICDFESYPKFLETIKKSKVLERDSDHAVVEFKLDLFKTFVYTLDLKMMRPNEVTWSLVESDMMSKNNGSWKLKKIGNDKTHAEYAIDADFGIWVPGPIKKFLIESSIPSTLESFKGEIEKRVAKKKKS